MTQFSAYMRFCVGKEESISYINRIEKELPSYGHVYILSFTDKQYANGLKFHCKKQLRNEKNEQLKLF